MKDLKAEEWLNHNELSYSIWNNKYRDLGETFDEWLDRVSGGHNTRIRNHILNKRFIFGGRILANRGTDKKSTYSNCYTLAPPEDNLESIFECATKLARTYSYGGGCGIDISKLAPYGARVHNAAKFTSGAVSFMDFFSYITGMICQEGRRGALMISIDCTHPDLEEFINLKSDMKVCTKANISVRISDAFMQAVIDDKDWQLHYYRPESGENIDKTVSARSIFKLLAKRNWEMAEPGILYWDKIKNYNMLNNTDFEYAGVNPCLAGDSLIQTVEGEIPIKDLVGTTPYVYCMDSEGKLAIRKVTKVWKTRENAKLVEVITYKGKLICTPDHRIYTTNRGWVEASNLHKGDKIKGLNRQTTGHKHCAVGLSGTPYEKEHRFVARHFYDISDMDVHHLNDDGFDNRLSNLSVISHSEHSAISNTGRSIEVNRDANNGRYLKKEENTSRTCVNLGKDVGTNWFVQEVKELDYTADVYDMTVEDTHNFIANGFVVHNCGEEPLPAGGSCLLGSINLSEFVIEPFTEYSRVNMDLLEEVVGDAVVALNAVLCEGASLHPLFEQRESVLKLRQIGLGTMGLADMLIKLGITYGSPESIDIINKVYKTIATVAVKTSCMLAMQTSCYPLCEKEKLVESNFIKALNLDEGTLYSIKKYGLYNSQLLTCAPTGSIGTMLEVSTGVEPIFAMKYTRKTISLDNKETYFDVYTKIARDYLADHTELPSYFVESKDIKPINRIKVQEALQSYTDAAISSTINLPNSATVDDVYDIYIQAWKHNLKGITVYRQGCLREGILTTDKPKEISSVNAPKRPKVLEADCYSIKRKGEQFIVLVGLLNNRPYEIFAVKSDIKSFEPHKGTITKVSKMHYSFKSDVFSIDNIQDLMENSEEKAATLYASMLLRHGVAIKYIVKTAKKVNENISSFTSAICRILSKYVPLEESGEKCPECGGNIINEGGCKHCDSCSYSKCE